MSRPLSSAGVKGEEGEGGIASRGGARSEAEREERILEAAEAVFFYEHPADEAGLEAVAERCGVTVEAILGRFGSAEGLFAAAVGRLAARVGKQLGAAEADDVEGAVRILIDHYEELGDRVLRLLGEEEKRASLGTIAEIGRAYHLEWCERVFAAGLEGLEETEGRRRLQQLAAVTDVYMWKLLRRQGALSLRQTEIAMLELVEALLERSY